MKKAIKTTLTILLALLLASTCTLLTSCEEEDAAPPINTSGALYPNTPAGFEFELSEAVLDITQSLTPAKEKDTYIPSMTAKITVNGKKELFYFDAKVTFIWSYQYVDEQGKSQEGTYSTTVQLNTMGSANLEEKIDLNVHRSVSNITLDLVFSGYAVKK